MTRALVAAGLLVLLLTGCGTEKLSSAERFKVGKAEVAFNTVALDGSEGATPAGDLDDAAAGVDELVAVAADKPDAMYDKRTVKQVAADAADTLRPYQPDLAGRLAGAAKGG